MSIKIMNEVIESAPVEQGGLLVMIMLADSADERSRECWPSVSNIAKRSRLSERQVQYCLRDLAERGLIEIEASAGRSGTNLYRLTRPETWVGGAVSAGGAKTAGVQSTSPGGVKPIAPGGVQSTSPEPSLEPSLEPSTARDGDLFGAKEVAEKPKPDVLFDRFWSVYPKKVGKPAALKNWHKAIKAGADPAAIIAAAAAYAKTEAVQRGFIKHPQGWLSEERWTDPDLQPPKPAAPVGETLAERRERLLNRGYVGEVVR